MKRKEPSLSLENLDIGKIVYTSECENTCYGVLETANGEFHDAPFQNRMVV